MADTFEGENLSFIFTTIARDSCARRLIDSVVEFYPKLKILVADQNEPSADMEAFYRDRNVEVHWVPFDFGVSAGRALLARNVKTPYLIFGDDDYVFTSRTRFAPVVEYLEARPDVAMVTGTWVDNFAGKNGHVYREHRRYETHLYRDVLNRGLVAIPIDHVKPRVDVFNGEIFYQCDLGLNWAMTRTSFFDDERFFWDSQFKTNGEHENFFLQIKEFGGGRVMFYPLMECDHRPEAPTSYLRLRNREDGWVAFGRKWDVDWFLLVGKTFHEYRNYSGSGITYASAGQGAASYLPKRNDDYLRIWANGSAIASVSDSIALREANQRERLAWQKADKRIESLRERLEKANGENERLTTVNVDLRTRLKDSQAVQPSAAMGPDAERPRSSAGDAGLAVDSELARTNAALKEKNAELRARNVELRERNVRQKAEAQKQQATLDELRKKLERRSVERPRDFSESGKGATDAA